MGILTPCYLDTSAAIKLIDQKEPGSQKLGALLESGQPAPYFQCSARG